MVDSSKACVTKRVLYYNVSIVVVVCGLVIGQNLADGIQRYNDFQMSNDVHVQLHFCVNFLLINGC